MGFSITDDAFRCVRRLTPCCLLSRTTTCRIKLSLASHQLARELGLLDRAKTLHLSTAASAVMTYVASRRSLSLVCAYDFVLDAVLVIVYVPASCYSCLCSCYLVLV